MEEIKNKTVRLLEITQDLYELSEQSGEFAIEEIENLEDAVTKLYRKISAVEKHEDGQL